MRVVFLQYMFQNDGSTKAALELIRYLSNRGCNFLVIYSRRSEYIEELDCLGIKHVRIPFLMSSDRGYKGVIRMLYLLLSVVINVIALSAMCITSFFYKPDIIHTNVSPIHLGYYLSKIMNVPHIWHLREFRYKTALAQPITSWSYFIKLLQKSESIATTKALKEYYGLCKCRVIYDGVIKEKRSRQLTKLEERLNSFLFVGRVEKSKGIEILLNSFSKFLKEYSDWQLDVIGCYTEDYHEFLLTKISQLNIDGHVHFLGVCNDVEQKMAERKVVVISSLSEGFGYVTVEAMANKCFVIGNDNTGTQEQLDNAKQIAGYDVAYRFTNEDELLLQMKRFASGDYNCHQNMVDKAYEIVNDLYCIEQYGTAVLNYYKHIIKS